MQEPGGSRRAMRAGALLAGVITVLTGCSTSPLGQRQLSLVPESQMIEMGEEAYRQMRRETPVVTDPAINRYVRCVARRITREAGDGTAWEITVFEESSANAFALPGGKIGVHSGLLRVAHDQDQLAAVLGHEVAHVLADHANARVSASFAAETGLSLLQALAGGGAEGQQLMGLLGLGARYGVLMPYNRSQEREADLLGLDLMAEAGFDPTASVALWRNMAQQTGAGPPAFLSTHPGHGERIAGLEERMPRALATYERSDAAPDCRADAAR